MSLTPLVRTCPPDLGLLWQCENPSGKLARNRVVAVGEVKGQVVCDISCGEGGEIVRSMLTIKHKPCILESGQILNQPWGCKWLSCTVNEF